MPAEAKVLRTVSPLVTSWLIFYNTAQLCGWCYILYLLSTFFSARHAAGLPLYGPSLWALLALPTTVILNASTLEIVHALLGFVPSNPAMVGIQVLARLAVLVLIINFSPAAQASLVLALCLSAWALVEPPRYSYYIVKLLKVEPLYLHTWLRYSLFIVLYPLGIVGEFGCLVHALPGASQLYLALPNRYNVVYSHQLLLAVLAVLYLPGAPTMVLHMWRERAKQLGPGKPKTP